MTVQGAGGDAAGYRIEAVDFALDILAVVASQPDLGASDIARVLGGSRQRIFRMLKTLEARGMLERGREGKTYRLGYMALVLGNAARSQIDLIRAAEPIMRSVGQQVEETIQLRVREGFETICVARWEPERDVRVHAIIGRRRPLHAGSSKIFLAFLPEAEREHYLAHHLERFTVKTLVDPAELANHLRRIRENGYAVSQGEISDDLVSVTAPVFGIDRSVLAAINIAAPAARMPASRLSECCASIVDAAIQLSRQLGYPAGPRAD
ncbi:IclR family transcriptional regulator [Aureimonas flava]|uniref:IclR family transcriptional regulator n=1 Tax=Aureimonas flava TaxID=2320271 RepID=A0A3A1WKW6_9HYPH|nr:IclR family transcriptional regulator [Aureimonas flava]RIY01412.1 IclR family transcriptional regulator [Aureimonas flava]